MVKFCKQKLRHFYALTFVLIMINKTLGRIPQGTSHTINPFRFRVTFQIESTANRCRADETLRYLRPTFGFNNGFLSKVCGTGRIRTCNAWQSSRLMRRTV